MPTCVVLPVQLAAKAFAHFCKRGTGMVEGQNGYLC
jgi:hypothetical protein